MKLKSTLLAFAATLALAAHANEFRSADIHNADDYPTVVAVKHMSTVLEKLSAAREAEHWHVHQQHSNAVKSRQLFITAGIKMLGPISPREV